MTSPPDCPATSANRLTSVGDIWRLAPAKRDRLLDSLVPCELHRHYRLPPQGSWGEGPAGRLRLIRVPGSDNLRLEVWPAPEGPDPGLVLELSDTYYGHLEASWIVINDTHGPRFDVDRDATGDPRALGSSVRNLREEIRALGAGLAPNQIRRGLRCLRPLIERIEALATTMGIGILYVVPLAYHNAIKYEQYGFAYAADADELHWIHREFQPGGSLRRQMDGSRPFRMPWMADTARGRSWAIHDGILGRRWVALQMYKFVGRDFRTCTFPGARW